MLDQTATTARPRAHTRRRRFARPFAEALLFACAALAIVTSIGIVAVLVTEALPFFRSEGVSLLAFLTGTQWAPMIGRFGVLPLVTATVVISGIAILVATPLGLGAAIYLSEYASPRARQILKPTLELLAGVPTIVFGYFAITLLSPTLQAAFTPERVSIYNMAAAGLAMGLMLTPLVASMSEDALRAVPRSLREGSAALGATTLETTLFVVLPAALSGIVASLIVALSLAIGETTIVAIAAGAGPNLTLNPLESAETMTGHIARIAGGDLSYGSVDYLSIFAIGLLLFAITLTLNLVSQAVVRRFREVYE